LTVSKPLVELSRLSKSYGNRFGLKDASFEVGDREVFGVIGPNGAGKSTLVRILATLTRPTSGEAKVSGYDVLKEPRQVKRLIGVVLHQSLLYEELTGEENLSYYLRLYGHRNRETERQTIANKAALLDVDHRLEDQVGTLSSGLRKRMDIVRAIIHGPRLLLLDEPLSGLDREGVEHFKNFLKSTRQDSTVIFSTHSQEIAEEISDRIMTLKEGRIMEIRSTKG